MKCPECEKAGVRSIVTEGQAYSTLMNPLPRQWDEDGKPLPRHDPNFTTTHYSCSRGHRWTERTP